MDESKSVLKLVLTSLLSLVVGAVGGGAIVYNYMTVNVQSPTQINNGMKGSNIHGTGNTVNQ